MAEPTNPGPEGLDVEQALHLVSDDRNTPDGASDQQQSTSLAAAGTTALQQAAAAEACSDAEAGEAPLSDAPLLPLPVVQLPDVPQEAGEAEVEDKVKVVSRQLSSLSIPDNAAGSAAADGDGGFSPGSDREAALVGLEELPAQLSPSKANFSHVGAGRKDAGCPSMHSTHVCRRAVCAAALAGAADSPSAGN